MYIKVDSFKCCNCGKLISPDFHEVYFDFIDGEIFENQTNNFKCPKCGIEYKLEDVEIKPIYKII